MEVDAVAGPSSRPILRSARNLDHLASPASSPLADPEIQQNEHLSRPRAALAPIRELPRTTFVHLEYPGVVDGTVPALHAALESLSPNAPPYASVGSALTHLGHLVSYKSKVIECRLNSEGSGDRQGRRKVGEEATTTEIYRHPLVGVLVDTHDIVAVVRRRIWRKRKNKRGRDEEIGMQADDDSVAGSHRSQDVEGDTTSSEVIKEYSVDALGLAKLTGRWRKMADFAYEPDLIGPTAEVEEPLINIPAALRKEAKAPSLSLATEDNPPPHLRSSPPASDSPAIEPQQTAFQPAPERGGILAVHDAMARMDVSCLQSFVMPEEKEEYQVTVVDEVTGETRTVSNLRLPPPPRFSSVEIPFHYTYRQPGSSSKQPYDKRLPDGSTITAERWSNANRWQGLAPIQWSIYHPTAVPTRPPKTAKAKESRCDASMILKLRNLFEERPVWTRLGLLNQMGSEAERRVVMYQKEYLPLVAYAITDGAWKDTLVRYGFDVREGPESRFYQKLMFQGHVHRPDRARGHFKAAYGRAHSTEGVGQAVPEAPSARGGDAGDARVDHQDESENVVESGEPEDARATANIGSGGETGREQDLNRQEAVIARASPVKASATPSGPLQSHVFNGQEIHRLNSAFQLIDILDPVCAPYIQASGPEDLLASPHPETGWYTQEAYDRIKSAVGQRFRHVVEFGVAKDEEEVRGEITRADERRERRERVRLGLDPEATDQSEEMTLDRQQSALQQRLAHADTDREAAASSTLSSSELTREKSQGLEGALDTSTTSPEAPGPTVSSDEDHVGDSL